MKTLRSQLRNSLGLFVVGLLAISTASGSSQDPSGSLTPLQLEVEKQRLRLSSAEVEERRDAISRLASMQHPAASRAALAGLKDPVPIVRATSITAILSLAAEESSANLLPLLGDKDELVRREAAYALGTTRSVSAVPVLVELLRNDKVDEVRGAAAVALGRIASEAAVIPLLNVLTGQADPTQKKKPKRELNPFVLRSAARALGQIKSRSAVPVLLATLQDEKLDDDLRREAAAALGAIGDESALPALRNATSARDPYLAVTADAAIKDILKAQGR